MSTCMRRGTRYICFPYPPNSFHSTHACSDCAVLPRTICLRRVSFHGRLGLSTCSSIGTCRLFELLMAFDALRLRNIIQLFGILSMSRNPIIHYSLTQTAIVFHLCLVVFAALQIHQTNTALIKIPNVDCAVNFVFAVRTTGIQAPDHCLIQAPVLRTVKVLGPCGTRSGPF